MSAKVDIWQNGQVESGGRSKVAAMVEKIQESLATQRLAKALPAVTGDEPSSSSPLPDTGSEFGPIQPPANELVLKHDSSTVMPAPRMGPPAPRYQGESRQQSMSANTGASEKDEQHRSNSGYVGQDAAVPAPLHLQSKAPLPAFRRPSIRRTPSDNTKQSAPAPLPAQAPAPVPLPALLEDLDEFGDDMDFSTEDLDELMSQPLQNRSLHDIPPHPNPPPQPSQQQYGGNFIDDDNDEDDEFACDDLDETSFMEAELQATQSHRASRPLSK